MKKLFTLLVCVSALSLASNAQMQDHSIGDNAPDFSGTDLEGNAHSLSQYDGKYILMDLFAYWCGPCLDVAPIVQGFYEKYGCNGYDVIVLGVEYEGTDQQVHDFESQAGVADPKTPVIGGVSGGGGTIIGAYNPAGFPTTVLIGPDGKLLQIDVWPISSIADLENAFPSGVLTPKTCTVGEIELSAGLTDMVAYPNPAKQAANIAFESANAQNVTFELYNLVGEKMISETISAGIGTNVHEMNVSELAYGQYLVNVIVDDVKVATKKIQVVK